MPKFLVESQQPPSLEEFLARVALITSKRKVRPVVTPSGHRARGHLPTNKWGRARYESLLEKGALRIFEVSSQVRIFRTHPYVLALPSDGHILYYTPDAVVEARQTGYLVEVKAAYFLRQAASRERLMEILARLKVQRLQLVLMSECDVYAPGLQEELIELLSRRPLVGRYRPGIDTTRFDPLGRQPVCMELVRRWNAAKSECDDLLSRVMKRDPDDLIVACNR